MAYTLASATRGATDWGALALLFLLTGGATGYAVALAFRARSVARQGWAGVRAHPWPLIGLLCGTTALAIAVTFLAAAWLAGPRAADVLFHTHGWTETPLLVCGYVFTFSAPGRRTSAVERATYANIRAHLRQSIAAFVVAAASWLLLPLAAALGVSAPVRFVVFMLWPLALLVEMGIVYWWWWRRGSFVEIADGERVRPVPSALLHPVFWGWVWGTVFALLTFAMLGQMRAFP
ncbi:MAG TPA: hypothetical protein VF916_03525 [Ktedonobacterales bacterium]